MASAGMSAPSNFALANAVSCVVVSVDYRVAPETVFPGAVEDCYAGLKWLYNNANTLGVDENRIAIGGESAGGGLAAALALLTRDRGEVPIVHQHLVYPMIDDRAAAVICIRIRASLSGRALTITSDGNLCWAKSRGVETSLLMPPRHVRTILSVCRQLSSVQEPWISSWRRTWSMPAA